MDDKIHKIARLAFDPAAPEGEAVAAFLALRRDGDVFKRIIGVEEDSTKSEGKKVSGATYKVTLSPRSIDAFLRALYDWYDQPYFRLDMERREKITDGLSFKLHVYLDNKDEYDQFDKLINGMIDELRNDIDERRRQRELARAMESILSRRSRKKGFFESIFG